MRIVGGRLRGLGLAQLGEGDMSAHLRPTSDRVREAIFNLLINGARGNRVSAARVLDLFAGTGALGIEALSRGAAHASFVDDGARSARLIAQNVSRARIEDQTRLIRRDARTLPPLSPALADAPFDLVFLDPPYGKRMGEAALESAHAGGWLAPGATIIWEESRLPLVPAGFRLLDQRSYGATTVTLIEAPAG